jgi:hypothetical protein
LNGFAGNRNIKIIVSLVITESQCHSQEGALQQSYIDPLPMQRRHLALLPHRMVVVPAPYYKGHLFIYLALAKSALHGQFDLLVSSQSKEKK